MSRRLKIKKRKGSQNYTTIIAIVLILIIAVGACYFTRTPSSPPDETDAGENGSETPSIPDFEIELTGEEGETYTISSEGYKEMTKVEMDGGYKTSAGRIRGPHKYTGIPLSEVLDFSGGISNETRIRITAADGYVMVYTWEELHIDL